MSVHDKLVPAVYHVSFDQHKGFYLTRVSDKMELASKTYGMECGNTAHRIMNTFCDRCARNVNTGVLFSGGERMWENHDGENRVQSRY